ncbi:MAG: hypothetical protein A2V88_13015 [Elusimicrobia bacterium RBG_16_66_12]|nr:MAG: hypothetical protein A2V88_13015 [Elusimicrobia bacterium RBG_16_66_12]
MKRITAVAATTFMVVLLAMPAQAAKPPKPGSTRSAAITLDQSDPHLYDWVTFSLTYEKNGPDRVARPYVMVDCHQPVEMGPQGPVTWEAEGSEGATFMLGGAWSSSFWSLNDGRAYCVARLYSIDNQGGSPLLLAETSFLAEGSR